MTKSTRTNSENIQKYEESTRQLLKKFFIIIAKTSLKILKSDRAAKGNKMNLLVETAFLILSYPVWQLLPLTTKIKSLQLLISNL